jgi:hypothetical protein
MRLLGITWIAIAVVGTCCAQSPPIFTADYYLMDPQRYLNKTITLAVAFLTPQKEKQVGDLGVFDAYTYNLGQTGGHISVVAKKSSAHRLINLCDGTPVSGDTWEGNDTKVRIYSGDSLIEITRKSIDDRLTDMEKKEEKRSADEELRRVDEMKKKLDAEKP